MIIVLNLNHKQNPTDKQANEDAGSRKCHVIIMEFYFKIVDIMRY